MKEDVVGDCALHSDWNRQSASQSDIKTRISLTGTSNLRASRILKQESLRLD